MKRQGHSPEHFYEMKPVRQDQPGLRKRWFRAEGLELFIWSRGGDISMLQLSYKRPEGEFCLSWAENDGYRHEQVDDGETEPLQYKASPILLPDGEFPASEVLKRLRRAAAEMARPLRERILAIIEGFGGKAENPSPSKTTTTSV